MQGLRCVYGVYGKRTQTAEFFKYIRQRNNGCFYVGTNIGHNPLGEAGKILAAKINLTDSNEYSGHCWRRTPITRAVDAGLTRDQLKRLSGHRSDTVLQRYIDSSTFAKNMQANATSVSEPEASNAHVNIVSPIGMSMVPVTVAHESIASVELTSATIELTTEASETGDEKRIRLPDGRGVINFCLVFNVQFK